MPWECESLAKPLMGDKSLNEIFNEFIESYRSKASSPEMKEFLEYKNSGLMSPSFLRKAAIWAGAAALAASAAAMTYIYVNAGQSAGRRFTRKNKAKRVGTRRNQRKF
jgi:hypothetical protein